MNVSAQAVKYCLNFLLGLLSALVQFLYAYRIYVLSEKSLVFPVMIVGCLKHINVSQINVPAGNLLAWPVGCVPPTSEFHQLFIDEALGIAYMQQA
jgi:hypothetical protein